MAYDPLTDPSWQAMARECKLTSQILGSGITALGKADYADGKGNYYVGFFGLSIGLERFAKLILITSHILQNSGNLPDEKIIRQYGHNLKKLLVQIDKIEKLHNLKTNKQKPNCDIVKGIIDGLDSFADAKRGRYSNFDIICNPFSTDEFDPIKIWWNKVAEPILVRHYRGTSSERENNVNAELLGLLLDDNTIVMHRNEVGEEISDLRTASSRTGETKVVQKYGRYYTLTLIRWMADIFDELTHTNGYNREFGILFGHYEHFSVYRDDDNRLKSKKVWP